MTNIHSIIAAINPNKYYAGTAKEKAIFKKLKKDKGLDAAIKKAKPTSAIQHKLIYDSGTETLEPIYFWILDFMGKLNKKVEKVVDNFASSPGSGHFSELQGKASQMQQEASRVLGTVNNILKGVLNLIYDLKEFKIRLSHYEEAKSSEPAKAEAGFLALKQIWMDKVDIQRGQGSLNAMTAGDLNFVTLRDAFLSIKSIEQIDKLDLNERVKRVLKPRMQEFLEWKKRSEQELRKRFEVEKAYLKSQVNALKLNSRWAKPYLRAAEKLTSAEHLQTNAALVTAFNTILLELVIMGTAPIGVEGETILHKRSQRLPAKFRNIKNLRTYNSIIIVDFNFRGIPGKFGQNYVFGGRAEVVWNAYALNDDEIALLKHKLDDTDLQDALKLVQGMTEDSLEQMQLDIDEFLKDQEETETSGGNNPFSALLVPAKKETKASEDKSEEEIKKEKTQKMEKEGIKSDTYAEKYIRNLAEADAMDNSFTIYDTFKKSMGMASVIFGGEKGSLKAPLSSAERLFGFGSAKF